MRGCGTVRPGRAIRSSPKEQQVEIERPGRIGEAALAVVAPLDACRPPAAPRAQAGVERRHGVEELRLVLVADGRVR
jgi:hypothetical protein